MGPSRTTRDAVGGQSLRALPVIGALVFGMALSFAVWWAVLQRENRLAEFEFAARAANHALILQNGINKYLHDISALRAMFQSSTTNVFCWPWRYGVHR